VWKYYIITVIIIISYMSVSAWCMQTAFCRGIVAQFNDADLLLDNMAAGSVADFDAGTRPRWFAPTESDVTWFEELPEADFRSRGFCFRSASAHARRRRQRAMSSSSMTVMTLAPRNNASNPPTWPTTTLCHHVQVSTRCAEYRPLVNRHTSWSLRYGSASEKWALNETVSYVIQLKRLVERVSLMKEHFTLPGENNTARKRRTEESKYKKS